MTLAANAWTPLRRMAPLVALLLCGLVAPLRAAPKLPPEPAPDFPSGCEPDLVAARLASPDSADVARACGNLRLPWGYRGWIGRSNVLRSYGRRAADATWAKRVIAALLDSSAVDTIYRAPAPVASCKPTEGPPIYLVRVHRGNEATSVLLRFDLGMATIFADEAPLGLILMRDRADALWALLGEVLEDDPAFRHPRPAPSDSLLAAPRATGEAVQVDAAPTLVGRGRDAPPYPEAARRQNVSGTVHVLVRVDAIGNVEDAVVHAGHPTLRDAALEIVWGMRFKPARLNGKPIAAWTMVPATFSLY